MLADRGTLVAKTARVRRAWAVRFVADECGRRVHRSVYVGGEPELVERAGRLLEEYRNPGRWADEVGGYARLAAVAGGVARRLTSGRGRSG